MAPTGKEFEAAPRGRLVFGLGQDAAPGGDHRVACKDMGVFARSGLGLFACHAFGIVARKLRLGRRFVDIGGRHAQPREQFAAARAGGSENQARRAHRTSLRLCRLIAGPDRHGPA